MTPQEIKNVLDAAGIKISEAARMFRVAHSTLYDWINGTTRPQSLIYDYAIAVTRRIQRATQMGLLPLVEVPTKERKAALQSALTKASLTGIL